MGFWSSLFGFDDRQAPPQVVNQATKFPEELAPYIKELLGEAQTLYGAQKEEGYQPYTGETIAPLTPEELQAQEGLKGLIGTAQPYLKEALETYRTGAEKFTPEAAQEYMSPYQRAVTDIEKREAQKVFERDVMPRFEKQAVQAGGMSGLGSRAAIQAGQLGQAQMQQMGDIEAKGLQKSYMDAQKLFAEQKARERTVAGDIGRTGTGLYQAGLADQGLLQSIGQQKRELGQTALDEAYYKFLKKQAYPQDIISQYSGTVYGAPNIGPSRTSTTTGTPYQPSTGQTLLGLGLTGLNIYGMGGGFGGDWTGKQFQKNMWGGKKGGSIGGLSGLPVVRRKSGDQVDMPIDIEEENIDINVPYIRPPKRVREPISGLGDVTEIYQRLGIRPETPGAIERREKEYASERAKKTQEFETGEETARAKRFERRMKRAKEGNPMARFAAIQKAIHAGVMGPQGVDPVAGMKVYAEGMAPLNEKMSDLINTIDEEDEAIKAGQRKRKHERLINALKTDKELQERLIALPRKNMQELLADLVNIGSIEELYSKITKNIYLSLNSLRTYLLNVAKLDAEKIKIVLTNYELAHLNPEGFDAALRELGIEQELIDKIRNEINKIGTGEAKDSITNTPRRNRRNLKKTLESILKG